MVHPSKKVKEFKCLPRLKIDMGAPIRCENLEERQEKSKIQNLEAQSLRSRRNTPLIPLCLEVGLQPFVLTRVLEVPPFFIADS